jgi:hypothetical protein
MSTKHSIFIQVSPEHYAKIRTLAADLKISKASARTLVELYLFNKSLSSPGAAITTGQRNKISQTLNELKNEHANDSIPPSAESGSNEESKRSGNVRRRISKGSAAV